MMMNNVLTKLSEKEQQIFLESIKSSFKLFDERANLFIEQCKGLRHYCHETSKEVKKLDSAAICAAVLNVKMAIIFLEREFLFVTCSDKNDNFKHYFQYHKELLQKNEIDNYYSWDELQKFTKDLEKKNGKKRNKSTRSFLEKVDQIEMTSELIFKEEQEYSYEFQFYFQNIIEELGVSIPKPDTSDLFAVQHKECIKKINITEKITTDIKVVDGIIQFLKHSSSVMKHSSSVKSSITSFAKAEQKKSVQFEDTSEVNKGTTFHIKIKFHI
jgi:hypothetical protein